MLSSNKVFEELHVWDDQISRTGPENMAVDQLLIESCEDIPILRVYTWCEPTVSFGYFNKLEEALQSFPSRADEKINYVRRWTGGGVVDHRVDVTYTLAIPRSQALALARGAESYQVIHKAIASVFTEVGQSVRLTKVCEGNGQVNCFANPVAYDLIDQFGQKVAGAGQRRSRYGLLHQGSVIPQSNLESFRSVIISSLPNSLSEQITTFQLSRDVLARAAQLAKLRYASKEWLNKR